MSDLPAPHHVDAPFLKIENITVRRNRTNVLKDVNLTIHRGEFVGMVGPNGGGKSTLVQTILGLLKCQSGRIHSWPSTTVKGRVRESSMGLAGCCASSKTYVSPFVNW